MKNFGVEIWKKCYNLTIIGLRIRFNEKIAICLITLFNTHEAHFTNFAL